MKTLCLTLLLITACICCCYSMPEALRDVTSGDCCFKLFTRALPMKRVTGIIKTHSSCRKKAFIVLTVAGRKFCYNQTFPWALRVYNLLHKAKSRGLQP